MKFLIQTHSQPQSCISECEQNSFEIQDRKNPSVSNKEIKFSSQNENSLQNIKFKLSDNEFHCQQRKIQELVGKISKQPKSQIKTIQKLFLQLGLVLSVSPQNISKINPKRSFISNFIQFTRQLSQQQQSSNPTPLKFHKLCINSLLFILMLLFCGDKESSRNQQFKKKLLKSILFLKNFLAVEIYKQRKISKLYGIIVVQIYKQNQSPQIKKQLVSSIIKNLKHIDHQKTSLNLSMILNELKLQYKLKQSVVIKQNLIEKVSQIYHANAHTFQSVYSLNYLLHISNALPNLSKISSEGKFEITENTKKFILSSKFYERTFLNYIELQLQFCHENTIFSLADQCLMELGNCVHSFELQQNQLTKSEKLISFLLDVFLMILRSNRNEEISFFLIEKGIIRLCLSILRTNFLDEIGINKIYQVILQLIFCFQTRRDQFSFSILSHLCSQMQKIKPNAEQYAIRRQKIIEKMTTILNESVSQSMELQ